MSTPLYLVLLHSPMTNRKGEQVTTSVTNMDIHDISRSCRTYGVQQYFIVTPVEEQHQIVGRVLAHWKTPQSAEFHPDRVEALSRISLVHSFDQVLEQVEQDHPGQKPEVVLTDARPQLKRLTYGDYAVELARKDRKKPCILVFGTGWGVHPVFHERVDAILEPIYGSEGAGGYNHLSVRSAVAIILDRLIGR